MKEKLKLAGSLFLFFAKIGCFTFGGGWGIVSEMQKEFVDKRQWISEEELLDYTSVGKSIPGTMISNVSFLFGYHIGGMLCAVSSLMGIIIMPLIIIAILTFFYNYMRDNLYIARALIGIRAAVIPIMVYAISQLSKAAFPLKKCYLIAAMGFALYYFFNVSSFFIVVTGIVIGLMFKGKK